MDKQQVNSKLGIATEFYKLKETSKVNQRYEVIRFDSCDEMISKIQKGYSEYGWDDKGRNVSATEGENKWRYGQLKTFDKTLQYLSEGNVLDSVSKKAQEIYETLTSQPSIQELMLKADTFKRVKRYAEEGAELCIDRIMCGDPAHWIKSSKGKKNPLVRLGVNLGGSAAESEEQFNNLVATIGVVSDILNRAGFSVEIYSATTSRHTTDARNYDTVMVKLKAAEQALDLKRIYSVGCSGFFRCWIFKVYWNVLEGTPSYRLGYMQNVSKEMLPILGIDYIIDSNYVFSNNNKSSFTKIENLFNEIIKN